MLTLFFTSIIALLFIVIVGAPEPWQDTPWSVWENCARWLLAILLWPLIAAILIIEKLPWNVHHILIEGAPLYIFLAFVSAAFWAGFTQVIRHRIRKKRAPNNN